MYSIFRHLRVLWRVEMIIARAQMRFATRRLALYIFAGIFAAFGLGMLNVAAYLGLEPHWGALWAALAAALGDFILALIALIIGVTVNPSSDLNSAFELRQAAIDGIETELGPLQNGLARVSGLARDPLDAALPIILVPLVTAIVRGLRKGKPTGQ